MNARSTMTVLVALCAVTACQRANFESLGTLLERARPSDPPVLPPVAGEPGGAGTGFEAGAGGNEPAPPAAGSGEAGAGASGSAAAGSGGAGGAAGARSDLTGSLGPNLPFASVQSGYVIGRSSEFGTTTLYLLDHKVDCDALSSLGWLSKLPADVQVIEVMFLANATTGTPVTSSLISRAHGGMYGFSKTAAQSHVLVLTRNSDDGVIEGNLMATFSSGAVSGTFHADFCASGMSF